MKEIIEKYKNGGLALDEFLKLGLKPKAGDVCRSDSHITVQAFSLSRWNELEEGDDEYKIVNSAQLDKEIAAMEKQYKMNKVSLEQYLGHALTAQGKNYYFIAPDEKEYRADTLSVEQLKIHRNSIYERIELTQEELHEQKVKELANFLTETSDSYSRETIPSSWTKADNEMVMKLIALKALEWMKQEG